jgi:hypothetical protein
MAVAVGPAGGDVGLGDGVELGTGVGGTLTPGKGSRHAAPVVLKRKELGAEYGASATLTFTLQ